MYIPGCLPAIIVLVVQERGILRYVVVQIVLNIMHIPHKHAAMCQYRACTGPMLPTSDQYIPGTGN